MLAGGTVGEVLGQLTSEYGELKKHLYSDSGQLRYFVNVYLNDEDIRYLQKDATPVANGDTITIVPAIAGGTATAEEVALSADEIGRYSRHLIMPEVTMEGQKKLKQARVLLIGAGGLGAPLGLYLAAARNQQYGPRRRSPGRGRSSRRYCRCRLSRALAERPAPRARAARPFTRAERCPVNLPKASSTRPAILSMRPRTRSSRADLTFVLLRLLGQDCCVRGT